jgi:hypothetical protein
MVRLARAEATQAVRSAVIYLAAALMGVGAAMVGVLVFVSALVLILIALGLPPWAAALIVALLLLIGGAATAYFCAVSLGHVEFGLPHTKRSIRETVAWLKAQRQYAPRSNTSKRTSSAPAAVSPSISPPWRGKRRSRSTRPHRFHRREARRQWHGRCGGCGCSGRRTPTSGRGPRFLPLGPSALSWALNHGLGSENGAPRSLAQDPPANAQQACRCNCFRAVFTARSGSR